VDPDCASEGGVCTSCNNGVKDGVEKGVDCAARCGVDEVCAVNADCLTGKCGGGNTCEVLTPADTCLGGAFTSGAIDNLETVEKACALTQGCALDADCGQCFGCACFSCQSGAQDGDETDVDCGSMFCESCESQRPVRRQRLQLLLEH
jgi:hypothetical protein